MKKNSFPFFSIPFFLCFIEGLIVLTVNLLTPSEVQSHFLFGLSLQRFLIMGVVLFVSLAFLWLAWDSFQKKEWFEKFALLLKEKPGTGILFWLFFGVGFIFFNLLLVPDYQWGDSLSLSNRFRPVMVWVMLIGLQFGIYLTINSLVPRKNEITILFKDNRSFLRFFLIFICIFLAGWPGLEWEFIRM